MDLCIIPASPQHHPGYAFMDSFGSRTRLRCVQTVAMTKCMEAFACIRSVQIACIAACWPVAPSMVVVVQAGGCAHRDEHTLLI